MQKILTETLLVNYRMERVMNCLLKRREKELAAADLETLKQKEERELTEYLLAGRHDKDCCHS